MNTRINRRETAERIEQQARSLRSRTLRRLFSRITQRLRLAAQPREHYLARSCDHADLEQRMQHWDTDQQRAGALCVGH